MARQWKNWEGNAPASPRAVTKPFDFQLHLHRVEDLAWSLHVTGAWAAGCRLTGTQGCVRCVRY